MDEQPLDIRERFALANILNLKQHLHLLTDWETEFVLSLLENDQLKKLTTRQFNKLHQIADDVRRRIA